MTARRQKPKSNTRKLDLYEHFPAWVNQRVFAGALLVLVISVPSGFGIWMLSQPDTLPIRNVKVEGEFRYLAQQDIYRALGGLTSGGFFNVDVRAVKLAAESLPWVDSASVRRKWPGTLSIEITEQVPLAIWGEDQLINVRGELFQPPENNLKEKLPKFSGPKDTGQKVAINYQSLSERLAMINLRISEITLNDRRAWRLRLENGLQILLGQVVDDSRFDRFLSVYPKILSEKVAQVDVVDLRYTNGFAVRWKESSTS